MGLPNQAGDPMDVMKGWCTFHCRCRSLATDIISTGHCPTWSAEHCQEQIRSSLGIARIYVGTALEGEPSSDSKWFLLLCSIDDML